MRPLVLCLSLCCWLSACEIRPPPRSRRVGETCTGLFVGILDQESLEEAAKCRVVTGALLIVDADLDRLEGLEGLEVVGRDVVIAMNQRIEDLSSLSSLRTIGGMLLVLHNPALRTLEGLGGLEEVNAVDEISTATVARAFAYEGDGGLGIVGNENLGELSGLERLQSVGGDFWVVDNASLGSIASIDPATEIAGSVVLRDNGELADCESDSLDSCPAQ